jgi:hypothetical protein
VSLVYIREVFDGIGLISNSSSRYTLPLGSAPKRTLILITKNEKNIFCKFLIMFPWNIVFPEITTPSSSQAS